MDEKSHGKQEDALCEGKMLNGCYKGARAGAKCDHQRIGVRANLDLDMRGACVRRKKRSQLTPCGLSIC